MTRSPIPLLALLLFVSTGPVVGGFASSAGADEEVRPARSATAADDPDEDVENGPLIRAIHWKGVEVFDEDDLEERIVTAAPSRFDLRFWRPRPRFDPFTLQEDVDRIGEAYQEVGYFGAVVQARVLPGADGDGPVVVEFEVSEGEPMRLVAWTLSLEGGASADLEAELRALLPPVEGQPFGSSLYRERRAALLDRCAERGHPDAKISGGATLDRERRAAVVEWQLDIGPRVEIVGVDFEGLDRVSEEVARRSLRIEEGDPYRASLMRESERRLVATDLFRSVVISTTPDGSGDPTRHTLRVVVEEAPPRSLKASIGYGTEEGARGEIGLDWRNFLGGARRLRLRAFGSFLDAGVEVGFEQPVLFHPRVRFDFSASALRQERPGYEAFVTGAVGLFGVRPWRDGPLRLGLGPGYEWAQITAFAIDLPRSQRGPTDSVITSGFGVIRWEQTDDPIVPTRGVNLRLDLQGGGAPIGSDLDFTQIETDLRGYLPIGPVVGAVRVAAGVIDPLGGGIGRVPLTRRFYAGGTNSVRGFGFQKLGPLDGNNDPTGGLSRLELGAELRIPVWGRLGVVGFVDAGIVDVDPYRFDLTDLRYSAGPGLRIDTPVGPIRLDAGFLLNPPQGTDPWRIHISIGHAF